MPFNDLFTKGKHKNASVVRPVADQMAILDEYRPAYAGYKGQPGNHLCWINNKMGYGLFFALPVASLMLENFFLFVIAMVCLINKDR